MHHTQSLEYNYIHRIAFILSKLKNHYTACIGITKQGFNHNISRTANRFIKIEKSMIEQINKLFNHVLLHTIHPLYHEKINSFNDMYQSNLNLIHFLKSSLRHFSNKKIVALLSYWVAGLQMENDEMAKHIHGELH